MSIRKVSELPRTYPLSASISDNLNESLLEISYSLNPDSSNAYTFVSKNIKYGDMVSAIIHSIVGSEDDPKTWDFYTTASFHKLVNMYVGLALSGDLTVNGGVEDSELNSYDILMRSQTSKFYAQSELGLSAQAVNVNTNTFGIQGFNSSDNIMEATNTEVTISKPTTINANTVVNSLTVQNNTTLKDLFCTGSAKFDNDIEGCALCARWADLAEGYASDAVYEPGTFVKFGGKNEITIADETDVNAVITTKPGFILGTSKKDEIVQNIALVGRTPVKVIGPVMKFDKLVMSNIPGVAQVNNAKTPKRVVARALVDSISEPSEIHLVEAVVQLQL